MIYNVLIERDLKSYYNYNYKVKVQMHSRNNEVQKVGNSPSCTITQNSHRKSVQCYHCGEFLRFCRQQEIAVEFHNGELG